MQSSFWGDCRGFGKALTATGRWRCGRGVENIALRSFGDLLLLNELLLLSYIPCMQHVLNVPVGVMNNELSEKSRRYNAKDHFDNILLKLYNISIRFNTIWRLQLFSLFVENFKALES